MWPALPGSGVQGYGEERVYRRIFPVPDSHTLWQSQVEKSGVVRGNRKGFDQAQSRPGQDGGESAETRAKKGYLRSYNEPGEPGSMETSFRQDEMQNLHVVRAKGGTD